MSARQKILEFMRKQAYRPMKVKELLAEFSIPKDQWHFMEDLLNKLADEGIIYIDHNGRYGLPEKMNLIVGRLQGNEKGFAFLIPDDPTREDIFISRENLQGAMHNDRVFVRLLTALSGKRQEGEVVKILERGNHRIVGNFEKSRNYGFVVPDNKRIYYDLFIAD